FFFQAEDGIRDDLVTGVQTCALPISGNWFVTTTRSVSLRVVFSVDSTGGSVLASFLPQTIYTTSQTSAKTTTTLITHCQVFTPRSEERRVGKECVSRRSPYH